MWAGAVKKRVGLVLAATAVTKVKKIEAAVNRRPGVMVNNSFNQLYTGVFLVTP